MTDAAVPGSHPKPAPRIEARDFSVTLGPSRVVALKGMTLTVEAGEIVVLVGPSGCGKTTFLNSVCGLLPEGAELSGSLTVAKDVRLGYMPQKDALLPWRTVLGNVEVGPELRGLSRAERRAKAESLIELVGLIPVQQPLSARAVGRHAPARVAGARARLRARCHFDGRAVCCARRLQPHRLAGGVAADQRQGPADGAADHPRPVGGAGARPQGRGHVRTAGTHSRYLSHRPAGAALGRRGARHRRISAAVPETLAGVDARVRSD